MEHALPEFVPGLVLARTFYSEIVRPLINIPHSAGLLGEGSEVLGFDQPRSTDHAWGPRLQIFVDKAHAGAVSAAVDGGLPSEFRGWPVRFFSWQTNSVRHHVEITTLDDWVRLQIGINPLAEEISVAAWLSLPQQLLLQVTSGEVFHDDTGRLQWLREKLAWYPQDVWLWALASQWHLIGKAEPRIGRTLEAGDVRGSLLISTRIVRLLMELAFLQERRYWPYEKWFGTAFSQLAAAPALGPLLDAVLSEQDNADRIEALHEATLFLARQHNRLGLTPRIEPGVDHFDVGINNAIRPYRVVNVSMFCEGCKSAIKDKALRELATVGMFDQLTHGDDILVNFTAWPRKIGDVYESLLLSSPRQESET